MLNCQPIMFNLDTKLLGTPCHLLISWLQSESFFMRCLKNWHDKRAQLLNVTKTLCTHHHIKAHLRYSKALRYADFGPKAISVAQKTVYLEVVWKPFKTVYLWGFVPKNDNQSNIEQNLKPCIFKISASWGCLPQSLTVIYIKDLPSSLSVKFRSCI